MAAFRNGSTVFSVRYELNIYTKCSLILAFKWLDRIFNVSTYDVPGAKLKHTFVFNVKEIHIR